MVSCLTVFKHDFIRNCSRPVFLLVCVCVSLPMLSVEVVLCNILPWEKTLTVATPILWLEVRQICKCIFFFYITHLHNTKGRAKRGLLRAHLKKESVVHTLTALSCRKSCMWSPKTFAGLVSNRTAQPIAFFFSS